MVPDIDSWVKQRLHDENLRQCLSIIEESLILSYRKGFSNRIQCESRRDVGGIKLLLDSMSKVKEPE